MTTDDETMAPAVAAPLEVMAMTTDDETMAPAVAAAPLEVMAMTTRDEMMATAVAAPLEVMAMTTDDETMVLAVAAPPLEVMTTTEGEMTATVVAVTAALGDMKTMTDVGPAAAAFEIGRAPGSPMARSSDTTTSSTMTTEREST